MKEIVMAAVLAAALGAAHAGVDQPWQDKEPESSDEMCKKLDPDIGAEYSKCMQDMRKVVARVQEESKAPEWLKAVYWLAPIGILWYFFGGPRKKQ